MSLLFSKNRKAFRNSKWKKNGDRDNSVKQAKICTIDEVNKIVLLIKQ